MREIPPLSETLTMEQVRRIRPRQLTPRERVRLHLHRMAASPDARGRRAYWNKAKQDFRVVQEAEAKAEQRA